jgi:hypothetical protein
MATFITDPRIAYAQAARNDYRKRSLAPIQLPRNPYGGSPVASALQNLTYGYLAGQEGRQANQLQEAQTAAQNEIMGQILRDQQATAPGAGGYFSQSMVSAPDPTGMRAAVGGTPPQPQVRINRPTRPTMQPIDARVAKTAGIDPAQLAMLRVKARQQGDKATEAAIMKAATEGYQDALRSGNEALIGQYEIIIDPVAAIRRYQKGLEDAETKRLDGSRPSFTRVGGRVAKITVRQWEADQRLPVSEQKYTSTGPERRVKVWRVVEGGPAVETSAPISEINNPENEGKYTYDKPPTVKADTMGKFYDSLTKKMVQIPRSVYDADPSRYSEVPEPPEKRETAFRLNNEDGTYEEVRATVKEIEADPDLLFSKPLKPGRPFAVSLITPVNGVPETFVTEEMLIEDMERLPGERLYRPPSGMRISEDGRFSVTPGVGKSAAQKSALENINVAFFMARTTNLLKTVQRLPGVVGGRGKVAAEVGGAIGIFNEGAGRFATRLISGASPEEVADFSFEANRLVAGLIQEISGEESGRFSEPERLITRQASRVLQTTSSPQQAEAALKAAISAYAVHGAKASYVANNRYRLQDKKFLKPLIVSLVEAGLDEKGVDNVLSQMKQAYQILDLGADQAIAKFGVLGGIQ